MQMGRLTKICHNGAQDLRSGIPGQDYGSFYTGYATFKLHQYKDLRSMKATVIDN
jgi:hypothetical protein